MRKHKSDYTPEEWERIMDANRERNRRYLAKRDPSVLARRAAACVEYRHRLATDPTYADKAAKIRKSAVIRTTEWQRNNPEKTKEHAKAVRQRNPEKQVEKTQRRNAIKLQAMPSWANSAAIVRHYANAQYLSNVTDCIHHVDHIIPLRGKTVCGLHVENNMRVVPHFINTRKGNSLEGV
jgi:hypothetical protein